MEAGKICDPTNFYQFNASEKVNVAFLRNFKAFSYTTLGIFVIISAPFVIIPPFFIANLNNTGRKIVSMIMLSDLISSLTAVVSYAIGDVNDIHRHKQDHPTPHATACYYLTMVTDIGYVSSLAW